MKKIVELGVHERILMRRMSAITSERLFFSDEDSFLVIPHFLLLVMNIGMKSEDNSSINIYAKYSA
jgi:hypothetical protein